MKPRIYLIVENAEGPRSEVEIEGPRVTRDMLDAAEDLLHTLTTGERPVVKGLYDLLALAFNTTREDVKRRLTAAQYGMFSQRFDEDDFLQGSEAARLRVVFGVLGEYVWGKQLFQTHDMCCVLDDLMRAAVHLSSSPTEAAARKLLSAAIGFVTQLGSKLGQKPVEMNALALQLQGVIAG